jgi:hypothetical protein
MTPAWVTIIVALATGLLATLIRTSHERAAELRGRMLDAADEFAAAVVGALHVARNTSGDILDARDDDLLIDAEGNLLPEIRLLINDAGAAVDEAQSRAARVHLLFDDQSPTGVLTTEIVTRLRIIEFVLRQWPRSVTEHGARQQYSHNFERVVEAELEFSRAALQRLRATWWRSAWGTARASTLALRRKLRGSE